MGDVKGDNEPIFLTVEETAEILRVRKQEVQLLARQKKLPAMKVGKYWRIHKEKLDTLIKKRTNYIVMKG